MPDVLQTMTLNVCQLRLALWFLHALHLSIPYQVRDKLLNSRNFLD
jgi:hypothetical protein